MCVCVCVPTNKNNLIAIFRKTIGKGKGNGHIGKQHDYSDYFLPGNSLSKWSIDVTDFGLQFIH